MGTAPRLKIGELRRILKSYEVVEDCAAGKGSHTVFRKVIDGAQVSYPVPTSCNDVLPCYVKGCRKKFKLLPADGVSDADFYERR